MTKLEQAAKVTVRECLGAAKDESVIVLADEPLMDIARLVWKALLDCKAKAILVQVPLLKADEYASFEIINKMIGSVDAAVTITSQPVAHLNLMRDISKHGIRILTLTALTHNSFSKIRNTIYPAVSNRSRKIADIFSIGREAIVTSVNGTYLNIPITRRRGFAVTGMVDKDERISELPGGEACISPVEGGTEGMLVVDSGLGLRSDDNEKIQITIKQGRASLIKGGLGADRLRKVLSKFGTEARLVAELGVGTNDVARLNWETTEEVKAHGAVHIAFGSNVRIGGSIDIPFQIAGVIHKATLAIDGKEIVKNGKLKIS